jgi:hypothetical protein
MSDEFSGVVRGEEGWRHNHGRAAHRRNARRPPPVKLDDEAWEVARRRGLEPATDAELDYLADQTPGLDEAHVTPGAARAHLKGHR